MSMHSDTNVVCQCVYARSNVQCACCRTLFLDNSAHMDPNLATKYTYGADHTEILSDPEIQEIAKISTFPENSRFLRFLRFSGFCRISGFPDLRGQTGRLEPELDFWLQRSGLVRTRFSDLSPKWTGPEQTCRFGDKSEKLVSGPENGSDPCTYRPLSIPGSVENDWGRRGPFSRSPLTLALETIEFWKKSANHWNRQNCRKRYIFFLYPWKSLKNGVFFTAAEWNMPPFATRRSHGIQTNFSDFLRSQNFEIFALFFDFPKSTKFMSDSKFLDFRLFRKSRDFPDFSSGQGFWQVAYGSLQSAKNSTFLRFFGFLRFLWFLLIFAISYDFRISGHFRKLSKKYDFGHSKSWLLRS